MKLSYRERRRGQRGREGARRVPGPRSLGKKIQGMGPGAENEDPRVGRGFALGGVEKGVGRRWA